VKHTCRERQQRWLAKLWTDPARRAAYQKKSRASSKAYYANLTDEQRVIRREKARLWAAAKRAAERRDPITLERRQSRRRLVSAIWRGKNSEHIRAYQKEWKHTHPELVKAADKRSYPLKQLLKKRAYQRDPSIVKARVTRWQAANMETVLNYGLRNSIGKSLGCATRDVPCELVTLIRSHLNLKYTIKNARK
jgi:hypothetical protein